VSGNRVMSPTSTRQPRRAGGTDAVEGQQSPPTTNSPNSSQRRDRPLAGIDPLLVSDQLRGDTAACLACGVPWSDLSQQCLGLAGGYRSHPGIAATSRLRRRCSAGCPGQPPGSGGGHTRRRSGGAAHRASRGRGAALPRGTPRRSGRPRVKAHVVLVDRSGVGAPLISSAVVATCSPAVQLRRPA
jgi:hypothetical protein